MTTAHEVPFTRLLAAVTACVPDATAADLIDDSSDVLLGAAYLIADARGLSFDHRHDREGVVSSLVGALRQRGVPLQLETEGAPTLIVDAQRRVSLKLTHADVERTFVEVLRCVDASVAQVFTLSPTDQTDSHAFAVLTPGEVECLRATLGDQFGCLLREVGKRPRKVERYKVAGAPAQLAAAPAAEPRQLEFGYRVRGSKVVSPGGAELTVRDLATVRALHPNWLADSRHVYFLGRVVRGLDPATTTILGDHHARDARQVFFGPTRLEVDPGTFQLFPESSYIRGECWGCDRDTVLFFEDLDAAPRRIGANPGAFRVLGIHGTDGETVWASGRKLAGVNAKKWERLPGLFWSRDDKHCYFFNHRLPGAHAASFEPVLEYWAMDRERFFDRTREAPLGAARAEAQKTFAFVGESRLVSVTPTDNGRIEVVLSIRCDRWLRRPHQLGDAPETGEEKELRCFLTRFDPSVASGPRVFLARTMRIGNVTAVRIECPGPAWEHQTLDRLSVMERWLALAD